MVNSRNVKNQAIFKCHSHPDKVEGDIKDTVYQIAGIAFFVREIPNQVGNDSFVIFIVILTYIMSYTILNLLQKPNVYLPSPEGRVLSRWPSLRNEDIKRRTPEPTTFHI